MLLKCLENECFDLKKHFTMVQKFKIWVIRQVKYYSQGIKSNIAWCPLTQVLSIFLFIFYTSYFL